MLCKWSSKELVWWKFMNVCENTITICVCVLSACVWHICMAYSHVMVQLYTQRPEKDAWWHVFIILCLILLKDCSSLSVELGWPPASHIDHHLVSRPCWAGVVVTSMSMIMSVGDSYLGLYPCAARALILWAISTTFCVGFETQK